ncbi:MAG: stage III sporulation protein AF [Oscillospiraceae bacterium]|nr:stage III sporulation protein AF [Oscillospiraceae bacterium]
METVKNWAFAVCCASIFGAILNFLLPESGVQKIYKTVFCVFFLCVLISPLSEIDFSKFGELNIKNDKIYDENLNENEFNKNSAEYIEKEIFRSAKEIIEEENLDFNDISVKVNISEVGSINITKFALTFNDLENPDYLAEKIRDKTGLRPEIFVSGEE